ncbi:F0F1 ATP synthase subunit A [Longispora sp. NPDC051575]|uniref:F0F1 ATP synthase subunit A n=1 Tax=Longispora sp. NPDC051575 TaxID=3154943 RepID=UPI0034378619
MSVSILAKEDLPWPPKVEDFYLDPLVGTDPWVTKFTIMMWIAVAGLIVLFAVALRKPKVVPTKGQWIAESVMDFVRGGIGREIIGSKGDRFVPYLTVLFCFIVFMNLFGIIPLAQISPMTHIAFPVVLAIISYVMYIFVGIQAQGPGKFFKNHLILPAPWYLQPLLIPIEFFQNFIVRPVTLSVRLFANMFAGHLILLVFTLGGFMLINAGTAFTYGVSVVSFAMAIAMTLFEFFVALLQAYVFVLLTGTWLQGALADEH